MEWKNSRYSRYQVSDSGFIKVKATGKILSRRIGADGYYQSTVVKDDGKKTARKIHRVVAEAFIGSCPDGFEVNHIDGNKLNNHPSNLEYITHRENMLHGHRIGLFKASVNRLVEYSKSRPKLWNRKTGPGFRRGEKHPRSKIKDNDVSLIKQLLSEGISQAKIARKFGLDFRHVNKIARGRIRK